VSLPHWWKDWRGETVLIIASGPSAAAADIGAAQGRVRTITVNNSWELAPWADAHIACDAVWWEIHRGLPQFGGLKLAGDLEAKDKFGIDLMPIDRASVDRLVLDKPQLVSGNSGFTAINLAAHFGARRILGVGFDCTCAHGVHWHGLHGPVLANPDQDKTDRWRRILDDAAPALAAHGVAFINCSEKSALTAYPKMSLSAALAAFAL